jgi:ketosteroid isomerase-like protein
MDSRETALAFFDAVRAMDVERSRQLFHARANERLFSTTLSDSFMGAFEGRDAIGRSFETVWQRWRVDHIALQEPVVDGERVAVRADVDVFDKARQRPARLEVMHFFTVDGGLIVDLEIYFESVAFGASASSPDKEPSDDSHPPRRPS